MPLCDLLFGHALGRAGLAWASAAKCVPHGGIHATIARNPSIHAGRSTRRSLPFDLCIGKVTAKSSVFPCVLWVLWYFLRFLPIFAGFSACNGSHTENSVQKTAVRSTLLQPKKHLFPWRQRRRDGCRSEEHTSELQSRQY